MNLNPTPNGSVRTESVTFRDQNRIITPSGLFHPLNCNPLVKLGSVRLDIERPVTNESPR